MINSIENIPFRDLTLAEPVLLFVIAVLENPERTQ